MTKYFTDLGERMLASFAGAVLAAWGSDAVNILHVDWSAALGLGAGAAVVSLLKGLVAKGVGDSTSASLASKV
jgi:hypothetical protein